MREGLALALFLFWTIGACASARLAPGDGATLPVEESKELLHQCSRGAPQGVTGTWAPTTAQIRELEDRLPTALRAVALEKGERNAESEDFRRQYAGFVVNGHKIIYVNAFPRSAGDPSPGRSFDWHRNAVTVCDGGSAFFGVVYDPEKRTFDRFQFNGPA
jgi:hypothetical protein